MTDGGSSNTGGTRGGIGGGDDALACTALDMIVNGRANAISVAKAI
jgi:hypothetical protein